MDGLEDLPPGIGQYDDFHTIDWLRDISRDRMRHRHIVKRRQEGCFEKLKGAHDAWSGWVCVLLVGCAAGRSGSVYECVYSVGVCCCYYLNINLQQSHGYKNVITPCFQKNN